MARLRLGLGTLGLPTGSGLEAPRACGYVYWKTRVAGRVYRGEPGAGVVYSGAWGMRTGAFDQGRWDVLCLSNDPPLRLGLRRCELNQALTAFLASIPQL